MQIPRRRPWLVARGGTTRAKDFREFPGVGGVGRRVRFCSEKSSKMLHARKTQQGCIYHTESSRAKY